MDYRFFLLAQNYASGATVSAGTVRVNMLSNLEAVCNIFANGLELAAVASGLLLLISGLFSYNRISSKDADVRRLPHVKTRYGAVLITAGLSAPMLVNLIVAIARDAGLFD